MANSTRIFVLSMPNAADRRARFYSMAAELGLSNWEFFDARAPGTFELEYDSAGARLRHNRDLLPSEKSCFVSHLGMMDAFLADPSATCGVFLEDDVVLDPEFDYNSMCEVLEKSGVGYLKLYARFFVPSHLISRIGRFSVYRTRWPALGTQAYALDKQGARKLTAWLRSRPMTDPVDDAMDDYVSHGIPAYLLYPFPVFEMNSMSSIATPNGSAPPEQSDATTKIRIGAFRAVRRVQRYIVDRWLRKDDKVISSNFARHHAELLSLLNSHRLKPIRERERKLRVV